ncbi:MAG: hypothetical protein OHK0022_48610 [Roseiflexaceae bacterium]
MRRSDKCVLYRLFNWQFFRQQGEKTANCEIRNPQKAIFGPDRAVATDLGDTRYERMAAMCDGHAEYVEQPANLTPRSSAPLPAAATPSLMPCSTQKPR